MRPTDRIRFSEGLAPTILRRLKKIQLCYHPNIFLVLRMNDCSDFLQRTAIILNLDVNSGFWQADVKEIKDSKTKFTYQWDFSAFRECHSF